MILWQAAPSAPVSPAQLCMDGERNKTSFRKGGNYNLPFTPNPKSALSLSLSLSLSLAIYNIIGTTVTTAIYIWMGFDLW